MIWKRVCRENKEWRPCFAWLPTLLDDDETIAWLEPLEYKVVWAVMDGAEFAYRLPVALAAMEEGE